VNTFIVNPKEGGQTLLSFLRTHLKNAYSVKAIKRAIDGKKCKINGRVEWFSTHPVKKGDHIEISLETKKEHFPITTLYEDEEIIIYNKPPGKVSESFEGLYLVHRLDKDTSGVIILAKTEEMQEKFFHLFKERKVEKEYLAICDGKILQEKWKSDNYLGKKASYQGGALFGKVAKERGKRAITLFTCLKKGEKASLVLAQPITGRTHQIRVHLKEKGHPVLGDWQYARHFTCPVQPSRHMLHAKSIRFIHPTTGEKIEIEAPLHLDFLETKKNLFSA